ncbi:hypothetical protein J6590_106110, partial [Homalodisca vitripennis]
MSGKRSKSPVSENTLIHIVQCAGLNFRSDSDSEHSSNVDSSDSDQQFSNDFIDDTDEDPSYDPYQPSTSTGLQRGNIQLPISSRNQLDVSSSDSEVDETPPRHRPNLSVPKRRRRCTVSLERTGASQNVPQNDTTDNQNIPQNDPADDDDSSWDEVEEGNDPPYNHQFTFSE